MIRERCIGKVNLEPTEMTTDGAIWPNFDRRFRGGGVVFYFISISWCMFILLRIPWFSLPTSLFGTIYCNLHTLYTITIINVLEGLSYICIDAVVGKHALEIIPKGLKDETRLTGKRRDTLASSLHMASSRVFAWGNLATTWVESLRDFWFALSFPQMRWESYKLQLVRDLLLIGPRRKDKRQKKKSKAKRHTMVKKIFRYTPTKSARDCFLFSYFLLFFPFQRSASEAILAAFQGFRYPTSYPRKTSWATPRTEKLEEESRSKLSFGGGYGIGR